MHLAITTTITARARAAGLQAADADGRCYSAHSTRAGFATHAADNRIAERDLRNHGRWNSIAVARGYVRPAAGRLRVNTEPACAPGS